MKKILACALVAAAACAACGPSVSLRTPPGFAVLDDQKEYVYRASSADGVVIGVRAEKNDPQGNLDFWSEVLNQKLRQMGYAPEGAAAEVRTAGGLAGREMKFTAKRAGRPHRFWIAVFVTEGRVWVVEAGGDADRFTEKHQKAVERAIQSMVTG